MKKFTLLLAVFILPVLLQADVNTVVSTASQAAQKNQVLLLFNLAAEMASACRQAVESGRWNAAITAGTQAQEYQQQAEAVAQAAGLTLYDENSVLQSLAVDPRPAVEAVAENVLFARVISGKMSLEEAFNEVSFAPSPNGLAEAILTGKEELAPQYQSISRAFRSWRGCGRTIRSLGKQAKVKARNFCQAD